MEKKLTPIEEQAIRQRIIGLFLFETPHIISWPYRKRGTDAYWLDWRAVKHVVAKMQREGLVKQIDKNAKTATFKYTPKAA